jgi:hypothetical protein
MGVHHDELPTPGQLTLVAEDTDADATVADEWQRCSHSFCRSDPGSLPVRRRKVSPE